MIVHFFGFTHTHTHTDLRMLSCNLLMRGEFDNAMILVRCLTSLSGVTTFLGQAVVRGMVLSRRPLEEILVMIKELIPMTSNRIRVRIFVLDLIEWNSLAIIFPNRMGA